jgi:hypothetical protein
MENIKKLFGSLAFWTTECLTIFLAFFVLYLAYSAKSAVISHSVGFWGVHVLSVFMLTSAVVRIVKRLKSN